MTVPLQYRLLSAYANDRRQLIDGTRAWPGMRLLAKSPVTAQARSLDTALSNGSLAGLLPPATPRGTRAPRRGVAAGMSAESGREPIDQAVALAMLGPIDDALIVRRLPYRRTSLRCHYLVAVGKR